MMVGLWWYIRPFSLFSKGLLIWPARLLLQLKNGEITKQTGYVKKLVTWRNSCHVSPHAFSASPVLIWEHSLLQSVPLSEETGLPSPLCRSQEIKTEHCFLNGTSWNSRDPGTLAEGHFDNKQLELYSGGTFPIFKKHGQGQGWWRGSGKRSIDKR